MNSTSDKQTVATAVHQRGPQFVPPNPYPNPLGRVIYDYIVEHNMSLLQFSEMAGIVRTTMVNIIQADHCGNTEFIEKIANALGLSVSVVWLLANPHMINDDNENLKIQENERKLRNSLSKFVELSDKQRLYLYSILGANLQIPQSFTGARESLGTISTLLSVLLTSDAISPIEKDALLESMNRISEILTLISRPDLVTPVSQ